MQGVYRVYNDKEGREVPELLTRSKPEDSNAHDLSNISPVSTNLLSERDDYRWHHPSCICGEEMNPEDSENALYNIKRQLGSVAIVQPLMNIYSVSGTVVAFYCNYYEGVALQASDYAWVDSLDAVKQTCGKHVAGTYGAKDHFSNGYMTYHEGLNFCGVIG